MSVNNGEQVGKSVLNLEICSIKGYIFERNKADLARGKCVKGIHDFEESIFDLFVLEITCHQHVGGSLGCHTKRQRPPALEQAG